MKKKKPVYKGIEFDSTEEVEFYQWCEEAKENDLISGFNYHTNTQWDLMPRQTVPANKKLKTKLKAINLFVFHPHVYNHDLNLFMTKDQYDKIGCYSLKNRFGVYGAYLPEGNHVFHIDNKGTGSRYGDGRDFVINQKLVFDKYGAYINKVIPEVFFKATWVPKNVRLSPIRKKLRDCYVGVPTIKEFLTCTKNSKISA